MRVVSSHVAVMILVVAIIVVIPMAILVVPPGFHRPFLGLPRGGAIGGGQLDELFKLPTVKPHPLAIRTDVHLHTASLDGS